MNKKPDIFDYNDFRAYLRDAFIYRHKHDDLFSKSFICKELGLPNSRSYFQDVINGKFVSQIKVPLFIALFKLAKEEAQFFRVLVNFNQSVDADERELFFEQLISLNQTPKKILSLTEYAYYKEWYHSVVRAFLNIVDFKKDGNYKKLGAQIFPPITERQAQASVTLLLELGLVCEGPDGSLKPTEKVLATEPFAQSEVIRQYQQKSLEIARDAILRNRKQPQRVITKMMSVSEEGYKRIEQHLEKFNSEITSIVHKDDKKADRVYQLDMVLFPHSKEGRE